MLPTHIKAHTGGAATVVRCVQALEDVAAHSEEGEAVSVTAEELQPVQSSHVQLLQARVPQVQLDDVDQRLGVSHSHRVNPVQPGQQRGQLGASLTAAGAVAAAQAPLPEVDVAGGQPLEPGHVQDGQPVSGQAELLQATQLLQDGRDTAELVEGQPEVGQALQGAQLGGQRAQEVPVQEQGPQAATPDDRQ